MTHEQWLTAHGFELPIDPYAPPVWTHSDHSIDVLKLDWTAQYSWQASHGDICARGETPEEALLNLSSHAYSAIDHAQMTIAAIGEIMP